MTTAKTRKILILIFLIIFSFIFTYADVVEKIYAVVNGELITYSELKNMETEMIRSLRQQYSGEELQKNIKDLRGQLLERLIEQKIILSVAKEKKYDIANDLEILKKEIRKQYKLGSEEELKQALMAQGLDYKEWEQQLKDNRISQRLIYEEIGSKINIDNSEIMAYYREHEKEFTNPMEFTLHCIYLDKSKQPSAQALSDKMQAIDAELKEGKFEEVATKHSELPGTDSNYVLGKFKEGELDQRIETEAKKLKKDELSPWVETETGWYKLRMKELTESSLMEYKTVRPQIEGYLRNIAQDKKVVEYVKKLKEDSHIKIYEEWAK